MGRARDTRPQPPRTRSRVKPQDSPSSLSWLYFVSVSHPLSDIHGKKTANVRFRPKADVVTRPVDVGRLCTTVDGAVALAAMTVLHDELAALLGGDQAPLDLNPPARILICGSLYLAGYILRENG